ncbi:hypothetical protein G6F65_023388 [Rhizopus arrhizus]|nr:hypothetical protein G6F65_023388 [Rhizopus arrhizus]
MTGAEDGTSAPRVCWYGAAFTGATDTLAEVARACGMSLGLLSQIERGLSSASVKVLHLLAREFHEAVN